MGDFPLPCLAFFCFFLAAFVWMVNAYAGHRIAISKDQDRLIYIYNIICVRVCEW